MAAGLNQLKKEFSKWGWILWGLGIFLFLIFHLTFIRDVPTLSYDEAWTGHVANMLADKPGFWVFRGVNAYVTAIPNYFTALVFKFFGTSLLVYRASSALLALAGTLLLSGALLRSGFRVAGFLFPALAASFPVLVINQRFPSECTTFQTLCLGLVAWGLAGICDDKSRRCLGRRLDYFWLGVGIILGILSHPLFLAPVIGILAGLAFQKRSLSTPSRIFVGILSIFFVMYFIWVAAHLPEKAKAFAVAVFAAGICVLYSISPFHLRVIPHQAQKSLLWILGFVAAFYSLYLMMFAEGTWSFLHQNGWVAIQGLTGSRLILLAMIAWFFFRTVFGRVSLPQWFTWPGWAVALVVNGAILIKPVARCYHLNLLLLSVICAWMLGALPAKIRTALVGVWIVTGAFQIFGNYILPGAQGERYPGAFDFKISKVGVLEVPSLQEVVRNLAAHGCSLKDVTWTDEFLYAELTFLNHSDWPPLGQPVCDRKILEGLHGGVSRL